jgi:hypothetical protein
MGRSAQATLGDMQHIGQESPIAAFRIITLSLHSAQPQDIDAHTAIA